MGCSQSSRLEFQRCRSLALLVLVLEEAAASLDKHEHCAKWANSGECEANPGFMWKTCESSCSRTGARKPWASDPTAVRCQSWVKAGECQTNADFMLKTCPSSCDSAAPAGAAPAKEFDQPSPARQQPAKPRNVSRNLKEEQQRQQEEIKRRAEQLRRERQQNKTRRGAATAAEIPVSTTTTTATVTTTTTTTATRAAELAEAERVEAERVKATEKVEEIQIEAKAKDAEPEALKPWQMPAPSDVDDETFKCMREKFEIARQLDDANAREQSVRERAEAANGRASASEQRHRDCLKDLSEANQERQRMRAQQSDSLSEQYEQRVQELREQLRKELGQETAKLQKECSKREFQLQELARVANKRADQAEAQLAGRATGEDRLQAERRAAEHAQEAQAAEQARLKIEEAYRAGHLREQELQERLAKAEARVKLLEGQLETVETGEVLKVAAQEQIAREPPVELVVEPLHCEREAEALFDALQQVFAKTFVLLWAPLSVFFGRPPLVTLPPNLVKLLFWMDRPAESVLEGLAALGGGSSLQMKDMCHVGRHVPGSAVCALAWLVTCASLAVYFTFVALRLAWNSTDLGARGASVSASSSSSMVQGRLAVNHLAALFLPVTRFFDAFSVPEDVRRIAERRAELGHSTANQGTATIGASGSEPEPEEIYRRPAALEALLAAEDAATSQDPRPSPRFGAPDGVHDSAAGPVTS